MEESHPTSVRMETGQDQEHESIDHQTLQDESMEESYPTSVRMDTEETESPEQVEQEILDMLNEANPTQAEHSEETRNSHHSNEADGDHFPEDFHELEEPSRRGDEGQLQRPKSGYPEEMIIAESTMPDDTNEGGRMANDEARFYEILFSDAQQRAIGDHDQQERIRWETEQ
jgi:hypothetical protein